MEFIRYRNKFGRVVLVERKQAEGYVKQGNGEILSSINLISKTKEKIMKDDKQDDIKTLREQYKAKFGKYPSSRMKLDKIKAKLSE